VADKARPVWLLLAVGGLVVAVVAGVSALRGGEGGGGPAADPSAVTLAAESAASSAGAPSGTASATADPAPTPSLTPPTGWPALDLPETHPAVVVERFLAAVFAADCDLALRQVTADFEQREGDCALFARDMEGWEYAVGETELDEEEPIAVVPATLTLAGQDERYDWRLAVVDGDWRIDDVEQ
jgi:hypothetical protein